MKGEENKINDGYWDDGQTVEGKEVRSYFKDTEEFPVGDPYENYYQHNMTIPTNIDHHCVPRINVFVQVYDDKCFNLCKDINKPDNCGQSSCKPLTEDKATIGVTSAMEDPALPSRILTSELLS